MRKLFLSIVALITGLTILGSSAFAAGGVPYSNKLFTKILEAAGAKNTDLTLGELFAPSTEEYGQDLYLHMMNSALNKPESQALQEVSQAYGLTIPELETVLNGGLSPLFAKNQDSSFTQEEAIDTLNNIIRSYEDVLALTQLEGELMAQAIPTEVFANGDLSDSGFDLIFDLDTIEFYLFLETTPSEVNTSELGVPTSSTPGSSGSPLSQATELLRNETELLAGARSELADYTNSFVELLSPTAHASSTLANQTVSDPPRLLASSTLNLPLGTPGTLDQYVSGDTATRGQSNLFCPVDSPLQDAVFGYLEQYGDAPAPGTAPSGAEEISLIFEPPDLSGPTQEFTYPDPPVSSSGEPYASVQSPLESLDTGYTPPEYAAQPHVNPAVSDFPPDLSLCSGIDFEGDLWYSYVYNTSINKKNIDLFCLSIIAEWETYTSFNPKQNCIQCTVAAINEKLKETISKSLLPSKLTGNLMESAKCKKGFNLSSLVNMQVYTIPVPIETPKKFEDFANYDVGASFQRFTEKNFPKTVFSAQEKKKDAESAKTEEAKLHDAALRGCQIANSDLSQNELVACINREVRRARTAQQEAVQTAIDETKIRTTNEFYQPVALELQQLNNFFAGFEHIYSQIAGETCSDFKAIGPLD